MNVGWLDFCLRVTSVAGSRAFYERLGFRRVEGDDAEGWAVMVLEEARLGLFEPQFMPDAGFSLNFRGGDVAAIAERLMAEGVECDKPLKVTASGAASARFRDPDGVMIFFDAGPDEVKPN